MRNKTRERLEWGEGDLVTLLKVTDHEFWMREISNIPRHFFPLFVYGQYVRRVFGSFAMQSKPGPETIISLARDEFWANIPLRDDGMGKTTSSRNSSLYRAVLDLLGRGMEWIFSTSFNRALSLGFDCGWCHSWMRLLKCHLFSRYSERVIASSKLAAKLVYGFCVVPCQSKIGEKGGKVKRPFFRKEWEAESLDLMNQNQSTLLRFRKKEEDEAKTTEDNDRALWEGNLKIIKFVLH